jgi:hypothetical protein
MKRTVLAGVVSAFLLMASAPGIRPRADADSYPSHQEKQDLSIGAALIPPDQAKKMFAADLNHHGYVVIEVGVFPGPGKDVDLDPHDFVLSVGGNNAALRPVDADTIAQIVAGKQDVPAPRSGPHDINTSTGMSVGRVSYPDPVTGRQTTGTVTTAETGVGIGGPAPQPCRGGYDCDTAPMPQPAPQRSPTQIASILSQELWEKGLPDGKTVHPVAGYLYFPKPAKKSKDAAWELRYETPDGVTKLPLSK